ncbi:MAG: DNA replication/repair protein RecF [Proteobacteria bacterium]|jgi:DNA replication and repair protein RecF|nr:DNA replication/repair protein RecF [Alphaproteobacteria bacterium]NCC03777.1 DNA replication/repair protein RecF [Pseudomonadota bacterium]
MPAPLVVSQLTLTNFRNHLDLRLRLSPVPVVITGPNGVGKTNILEAISLFVPGRGMCRAAPSEWQAQSDAAPWAVVAELEGPSGGLKVATGRDPASGSDRRIVQIDGRPIKNQQVLAEHVGMAWITPDMDRVLAEGPSARRKLVDRMAFSFDPAHAGRVHRYEKAMRERLRLLREGIADAAWLSGLEDEMARTGVAIAAARLQLLRHLQTAIAETQSVFPTADLSLAGMAEEHLLHQPALLVEDELRADLARTRGEDAQSGTCAVGVHRSDLRVVHRKHGCPAELCSTGEQKALLVAIMMAYVRTLAATRQMMPLFLLDDITAHLDRVRREALFEEILALGVQAWITGTDTDPFLAFLPRAQSIQLSDGS